jgi:hypothetical protein
MYEIPRNWKRAGLILPRSIEDIPEQAAENGEGINYCRQPAMALPQGELALFYNSGSYGREQMYMKLAWNSQDVK